MSFTYDYDDYYDYEDYDREENLFRDKPVPKERTSSGRHKSSSSVPLSDKGVIDSWYMREYVLDTTCRIVFTDSSDERIPKDNPRFRISDIASTENIYVTWDRDSAFIHSESGQFLAGDAASGMFSRKKDLALIEGLERLDVSKSRDMSEMFSGCKSLTSLNLTGWDTKNARSLKKIFAGCSSLKELTIPGFDLRNVTDASFLFSGCEALKALDLSTWKVRGFENGKSMFEGASGLETLDLTGWKSDLTITRDMFRDCTSLREIKSIGFKTGKVRDMSFMFAGCESLKVANLKRVDTRDLQSAIGVFSGCEELKKVDLAGFHAEHLISLGRFFEGCKSLQRVDLTGLDTENVTDTRKMFRGCESLTAIDLTPLNLESVCAMDEMFYGCKALESIDLSKAKTPNLLQNGTAGLFTLCKSLKEVKLPSSPLQAEYIRKAARQAVSVNNYRNRFRRDG